MIEEIQFVNAKTNAPLITVKGDMLEFLRKRSGLVKELLELSNAKQRFLTLPLDAFPQDRRMTFIHMLKGLPVGKMKMDGSIQYYPLGSDEERDIASEVEKQLETPYGRSAGYQALVNRERERVLVEIMQYLLLSPEDIDRFFIIDPVEYNTPSEDDEIDNLVANHIMWLALTGQNKKLTNVEKNWFKKQIPTGHSEAYIANYGNSGFYNVNTYRPVSEEKTASMTPRNYERYLRTVIFKKAREGLPLLNYQLNILYNNNARKTRSRANERNNSAVVFYDPENKRNQTRRRNNKIKKKNNGSRNAW
jgi:hypothetical protein